MSGASTTITRKLKWPPHPYIAQKCWEVAEILRKGSLETVSAGLTLLLLKSMTPVTLAWTGAFRPMLSTLWKPPLMLQFRAYTKTMGDISEKGRMRKNCSFGAEEGEWLTHKHTTCSAVLLRNREQNKALPNCQRDLNIARFLEKQLHLRYVFSG